MFSEYLFQVEATRMGFGYPIDELTFYDFEKAGKRLQEKIKTSTTLVKIEVRKIEKA